MSEQPHLLTVGDVARWLRVAPSTVRRWAASGELRAARAGRGLRFTRDDVEAFLGHAVEAS